jgi:hypothetical protein
MWRYLRTQVDNAWGGGVLREPLELPYPVVPVSSWIYNRDQFGILTVVKRLDHINKLDDGFGRFLVRIQCECKHPLNRVIAGERNCARALQQRFIGGVEFSPQCGIDRLAQDRDALLNFRRKPRQV